MTIDNLNPNNKKLNEHHRSFRYASLLLMVLLWRPVASAEPVAVRYEEGSVHGFLALRSLDGKTVATGDLIQIVRGDRVTSHLVFSFKDGSAG